MCLPSQTRKFFRRNERKDLRKIRRISDYTKEIEIEREGEKKHVRLPRNWPRNLKGPLGDAKVFPKKVVKGSEEDKRRIKVMDGMREN